MTVATEGDLRRETCAFAPVTCDLFDFSTQTKLSACAVVLTTETDRGDRLSVI